MALLVTKIVNPRGVRGGTQRLGFISYQNFLRATRGGPIGLAWDTSINFLRATRGGADGLACYKNFLRATRGGPVGLAWFTFTRISPRCTRGGPVTCLGMAWLTLKRVLRRGPLAISLTKKLFSALRAGGPLAWVGLACLKKIICAQGGPLAWFGLAWLPSINFLRATRGGACSLGLSRLTF